MPVVYSFGARSGRKRKRIMSDTKPAKYLKSARKSGGKVGITRLPPGDREIPTEETELQRLLDDYAPPPQTMDQVEFDEDDLTASICKDSFYEFVKEFWSVLIPEKPVWNWHMEFLCDELQALAERVFAGKEKLHDEVVNISPGTSKSSIASVFLCPWAWTRMPSFRFIGASYSFPLAMDLSRKSRDVIQSDKYKKLFSEVKLREDQNTKGYFQNVRGGYRYAVGINGSVTGMHGHFICLPWESRVITDKGVFPIGQVVDNKMQVHIMTFNHQENKTRWQPIEAHEKQPGRPICRVLFSTGEKIELTDDHQIFVPGRGYVDPVDLQIGDEVYYAEGFNQVRSVSEGFPLCNRKDPGVVDWNGVLRVPVFEESPTTSSSKVFGVPKGNQTGRSKTPVLQSQVPCSTNTVGRPPKVGTKNCDLVLLVREEDPNTGTGIQATADSLLLQELREHATLLPNEGQKQFQLCSRKQSPTVFAGVCSEAKVNPDARKETVLPVRRAGAIDRQEIIHPSRGLRQAEQPKDEFGRNVSELSREPASEILEKTSGLVRKVVSAVELEVRVPDSVYNLRVAEDHNYFAEGILVHNCIDDPLDPNQAISAADLKAANVWIRETLSSRKVDKSVTPTVLIMQRLHQDDPTAQFLTKKRIRHVCLPAEIDDADPDCVKPHSLRRFYVDGLMDPIRLGYPVLTEAKENGEYYYSAQFRQNPVPAGGGMFKTKMVRYGPGIIPPTTFKRVVRYWDKAGTKGGGAFTVGTKMGCDLEGKFWVLDVVRFQEDSYIRERRIRQIAESDGYNVTIGIEEEPGSGGKGSAQDTVSRLAGYKVITHRVGAADGDKITRADPFSVQVNAGNVYLAYAVWNEEWIQEFKYFPYSKYKDQVDSASGAFSLCHKGRRRVGGLIASDGVLVPRT